MSNDFTLRPDGSTSGDPQMLTRDVLAFRMSEALYQAHLVEGVLEDVVMPRLSAHERSFAMDLLTRMETESLFERRFVRDLETFIASLEARVAAGTSRHWQADEYHIDGGYEFVVRDDDAQALASAMDKFVALNRSLASALSAARAIRDLDGLLER